MNLAPRATTVRVACLESVALPPPLPALIIEQDRSVSTTGQGGTGGVLWPASVASGHFLVHHYYCSDDEGRLAGEGRAPAARGSSGAPAPWPDSVVELGSGTGVLGLAAAALFATGSRSGGSSSAHPCRVLLSDQRNVQGNLQGNVARNAAAFGGSAAAVASAVQCDWNVASDRQRLLAALEHAEANADAARRPAPGDMERESAGGERGGETLVLCSDLVFGNAYGGLLDFLEELQATGGRQPPSSSGNKARSPQRCCRILFAFEERSDRFPSPGFWPALKYASHLSALLAARFSCGASRMNHVFIASQPTSLFFSRRAFRVVPRAGTVLQRPHQHLSQRASVRGGLGYPCFGLN